MKLNNIKTGLLLAGLLLLFGNVKAQDIQTGMVCIGRY